MLRRWFRSALSVRSAVPLLVVLGLSLGGFFYVTHAVDDQRTSAADRQARVDAQRTEQLLERAGDFETGVGDALAAESVPNALRFQAIVGSGTAPVGLGDAMWVEKVTAADRHAYEARVGAITVPPSTLVAGPAPTYFPATFVTGLPYLPGTNMSAVPALAEALRSPLSVFAGTATGEVTIAGQRGFFLLQGARFGQGPGSQGFVVLFVPAGWLSQSLTSPSDAVAIDVGTRHLAGTFTGSPAASRSFSALTRQWRIVEAAPAPTPLQSTLPGLALAWPFAVALIMYFIGRGMLRRRRAEREVDDIFDLSGDLLCTIDGHGYLKRVNPAFERTLGYDADRLLTQPLLSFVHPDDRQRTAAALARLHEGQTSESFETRFVRADGAVRWLQWNVRAPVAQGPMYAAAHDVTDTQTLLQEQAALRHVATLVAGGAQPSEVFAAATHEVGLLLSTDVAWLRRYIRGPAAASVAAFASGDPLPPQESRPLGGHNVATLVYETGRPARVADSDWPLHDWNGQRRPMTSAVGAPLVVDGHLWGVMAVASSTAAGLPADTEGRLADFTELVAMAIANAEAHDELTASRARVVATADEARRRIERDLHDGAQQSLVSTMMKLKIAEKASDEGAGNAQQLIHDAVESTERALEELGELARGIHPVVLTRNGLTAALKALARRSPIPVALDVNTATRLPERTEATAYFVVAEALTNAAKHSGAPEVRIAVTSSDGTVRLSIDDDGIGGADPANGSGLVGLKDRVEAVEGTLTVQSRPGEGTHIAVELPLTGANSG